MPEVEQEHERGYWTNHVEFLLSCLGYAVGLGNVWRFPYLTFKYGGGAFLIPYLFMLAFVAIPLFLIELFVAQYSGRGPNICYLNMCPAFRGIGYSMVVICILLSLFYNVIIAWAIYYLGSSFTSVLPWKLCNNPWNTESCYTDDQNNECLKSNLTFFNGNCTSIDGYCLFKFGKNAVNATHCSTPDGNFTRAFDYQKVFPSEEFFYSRMLKVSDSIDNYGTINRDMVLSLFVAWVIVCFCLIKGVKSSGKVVYFTALFPYVVIIALIARGLTLPGSSLGIQFYLTPVWKNLKNFEVWREAAVQIFFSTSVGFGGMLTMASYNPYHTNCSRDTLFVALSNSITSIIAGFAIFSVLGFMAHITKLPIEEIAKTGPALAFVVYPEALTKLPVAPVWSILFFLMLITLGLDSQFVTCELVITSIQDEWPSARRWKLFIVVGYCIAGFVIGLSMCFQGGYYLFMLMDQYSIGWPVIFTAGCEIVTVIYIYGYKRVKENFMDMIGKAPNVFFWFCWMFVTPPIVAALLIFSFVYMRPFTWGKYVFPEWTNHFGWFLSLISVVMIPFFAIIQLIKNRRSGLPWYVAFRSTENWLPNKPNEEMQPSL